MEPFEFVLKNEKRRFYDRIAVFTFLLDALGIIYYFIRKEDPIHLAEPDTILAIIAFISLAFWFLIKEKALRSRACILCMITSGFFWIGVGQWWISLLLILVMTLYLISKRPLRLLVAEDLVIYPSFPKKEISWRELSNLVLKDELLTIDFRNNRIIQQLVESLPIGFDEKEFNEFCDRRILT